MSPLSSLAGVDKVAAGHIVTTDLDWAYLLDTELVEDGAEALDGLGTVDGEQGEFRWRDPAASVAPCSTMAGLAFRITTLFRALVPVVLSFSLVCRSWDRLRFGAKHALMKI